MQVGREGMTDLTARPVNKQCQAEEWLEFRATRYNWRVCFIFPSVSAGRYGTASIFCNKWSSRNAPGLHWKIRHRCFTSTIYSLQGHPIRFIIIQRGKPPHALRANPSPVRSAASSSTPCQNHHHHTYNIVLKRDPPIAVPLKPWELNYLGQFPA